MRRGAGRGDVGDEQVLRATPGERPGGGVDAVDVDECARSAVDRHEVHDHVVDDVEGRGQAGIDGGHAVGTGPFDPARVRGDALEAEVVRGVDGDDHRRALARHGPADDVQRRGRHCVRRGRRSSGTRHAREHDGEPRQQRAERAARRPPRPGRARGARAHGRHSTTGVPEAGIASLGVSAPADGGARRPGPGAAGTCRCRADEERTVRVGSGTARSASTACAHLGVRGCAGRRGRGVPGALTVEGGTMPAVTTRLPSVVARGPACRRRHGDGHRGVLRAPRRGARRAALIQEPESSSEPTVASPSEYEWAPLPARRPPSTIRYSSRIDRPSKKHSRISRVPAA